MVTIDQTPVVCGPVGSDQSWSASFVKTDKGWQLGKLIERMRLKKPGLQGPIDDAFLDSFLMVRPTGKSWHNATAKWAKGELDTEDHWRKQFRGVAVRKTIPPSPPRTSPGTTSSSGAILAATR